MSVFSLKMMMAEVRAGGILCLSADQLTTTLIQWWVLQNEKYVSSTIGKHSMLFACSRDCTSYLPSSLPRSRKMLTDTASARVDQRPSAAFCGAPEVCS
jgi:hypothetical protein